MPTGTKSLLGYGLKYCIKMPLPTNKWKKTLERLKNDVRRIAFFKFNPPEEPPATEGPERRYIPELLP